MSERDNVRDLRETGQQREGRGRKQVRGIPSEGERGSRSVRKTASERDERY